MPCALFLSPHGWHPPSIPTLPLCLCSHKICAPLCFHNDTNCFSRKPFILTTIRIARGVGGARLGLVVAVAAGEFADDVAYEILGVAEEHQRVVQVIQRVVDAGEAGGHAALDDHDGARFVDVQDGHAEDGAGGVGAGGGIGDIVGADDQRDVGLRHVAVDGVHVEELVVGDVGFGEQHVHVAGHASGDGVNAEGDVDAALGERVEKFAHFVLRLRNGHAVARNDDHFVGGGENRGGFFGGGAFDGALLLGSRGGGLNLPEAAEEYVGERAVHGLGHDDGQNEAG